MHGRSWLRAHELKSNDIHKSLNAMRPSSLHISKKNMNNSIAPLGGDEKVTHSVRKIMENVAVGVPL